MAIETATDLISKIQHYNPRIDAAAIEGAYQFARNAHHGQLRASGDAYITHPLQVASILADMGLDEASIVTALLHDVVEDTDITIDAIMQAFSAEIGTLVDGVTKLTRIETQSNNEQAENFRKLVLAMSADIRVLIVKLADRIHNMRTIEFIEENKQKRIARDTLEIFAPLSERVGITHFQHELEDRAFAVIHPNQRQSIITRIESLTQESDNSVGQICAEIRGLLEGEGLAVVDVSGRQKTPYSIWRKLQQKKVEMEELADIMAFRIIVEDREQCYRTLGIIHRHFKGVMGRFKDYISTPKRNNYQSLHTGVIGPFKKKIEIQIRTPEMHEIAERGVAAHWHYKERGHSIDGGRVSLRAYPMKWINDLVNILEDTQSSDELWEHTQLEMYADQVFCFTPKGALIALPKDSTTVDFAYAVHTDIGNRCVAAKINGKMRQLATPLANGDQVEILTKKGAKPNPEWENFVKTGRAKSIIRRFIRQEKMKEFSRLGKALVLKTFRAAGKRWDKAHHLPCLRYFNLGSEAEFFARIGEGRIDPTAVLHQIHPDIAPIKTKTTKPSRKPALNIKGLTAGVAVHIGKCCHPLPGERIVGITTHGKGLTVHRSDCQNLEKFNAMPELWVDLQWAHQQPNVVTTRLEAVLSNRTGSLASVASQISQNSGNITNIQLIAREVDFFKFFIDIEVSHIRHMNAILAALRANESVESIERARG